MKNIILTDPCTPVWVLVKEVVKTYVKIVKDRLEKIWKR